MIEMSVNQILSPNTHVWGKIQGWPLTIDTLICLGVAFLQCKKGNFSPRGTYIIRKPPFLSGQTPDDDGNYAFQFATDDGQYRQETGRQVATADGDATEITGSNPIPFLC